MKSNLSFFIIMVLGPAVLAVAAVLWVPIVGLFLAAMLVPSWYFSLAWNADNVRVEYFTHHLEVMREEEDQWYWEL